MSTMMSNWRRILFLVLTIWTARVVNFVEMGHSHRIFFHVYYSDVSAVLFFHLLIACKKCVQHMNFIWFESTDLVSYGRRMNVCLKVLNIFAPFKLTGIEILTWKILFMNCSMARQHFLHFFKHFECTNFFTFENHLRMTKCQLDQMVYDQQNKTLYVL